MNYLKALVFVTLVLGLLILAGGSCIGLMTNAAVGVIVAIMIFLVLTAGLLAAIPGYLVYSLARQIVPRESQLFQESIGTLVGGVTWLVLFLVAWVGVVVYLSDPIYNLVKTF